MENPVGLNEKLQESFERTLSKTQEIFSVHMKHDSFKNVVSIMV